MELCLCNIFQMSVSSQIEKQQTGARRGQCLTLLCVAQSLSASLAGSSLTSSSLPLASFCFLLIGSLSESSESEEMSSESTYSLLIPFLGEEEEAPLGLDELVVGFFFFGALPLPSTGTI